MTIHATKRRPRLAALLFPFVLLLAGSWLPPGVTIAAESEGSELDPQEELRLTLFEHRQEEAVMKNRLARLVLESEAAQTRNQVDYDARHYDLDLDLNPSTNILTGTVVATVEVLAPSITIVELDLRTSMTVSAATSGGNPTNWSHANHVVTVNLDRAYTLGETVVVSVSYSGNPSSGYFGWDSYGGQDMIWTLSEPYGARYWWPCKDVNSDKPDSLDIQVTVPDNLIVASNGALVSDVDNGATRTFTFDHDYPIATYLVSLAIHPYTVYSDWYTPQGGGDPMEVVFYVFPDLFDEVQENFGKTVPMLDVFAQGFGEYPFVDEKYGHAMFTWGGGMEHQTITSLGGWWEDVISHEAAHQWWGDMITCEDFQHIWLNEGFATWSEAYWKEQTEGFPLYQQYMDAAAYYGSGTIIIEDPYNDNIFNTNLSYNKASWVVHMVRGVVGDTDFFDGLALYRATYGYDSATTEEFRDVMETMSGLDLDQFFQQWIYGEYFPVYHYEWTDNGGTVDLTVEQVQTNTGLFTMPIQVRVVTDTDTFEFVVQNSQASEQYQLPVTGVVESVLLDPDRWILRQIQTEVTDPTFEQGILLVNGVDWNTYGTEIYSAYEDSVFWGDNDITFWDNFIEPGGGYPANLPAPLGHGPVPADVIGQYSSVVWVGNHYNGDLPKWQETPILSYLETGGNVLLMTRRGMSFLEGPLTDFLGITWAADGVSLNNCTSTYLGLVDIPFTNSQSWADVFFTSVGPNSLLLFKDTTMNRGTGVHAQPPGGGTHRPDGAQFVHVAGRPYRMDHDALRANVEFILEHFFGEPYNQTTAPGDAVPTRVMLSSNYPNPFNPHTTIPYALPAQGRARLAIYDVAGRLVSVLVDGLRPAGEHTAVWNGEDDAGRPAASGVYIARLQTKVENLARPMVLLR